MKVQTARTRTPGGRWGLGTTAVALLVGMAACATSYTRATPEASEASSGAPTTVRIRNDGSSTLTIYSEEGATTLTTLSPNQTQCVRIAATSDEDQLVAEPVGGGVSTTSDSFKVRPGDGWTWTIPAPQGETAELVPSRPCALPTTNAP